METDRRGLLAVFGAGVTLLPVVARSAALMQTPTEDLGPFYPFVRPKEQDDDLTRLNGHGERAQGTLLELTGRVLFPNGSPAKGVLLDVWQANAAGRYSSPHDTNPAPLDPNFQGSARLRSGVDGSFRIITIKPGTYPVGGGKIRTPHIHFDISARDTRSITQMYFPDEPTNDRDLLRPRMAGIGDDPELLTCRALPSRADGMARFAWEIVILKS
jgi:protocatechuate 3,4-dioxygenase, beta subunit